jgi:hypothetical protein
VVEVDDQLVEDSVVMIDLAGDLATLLDQAGNGAGCGPSRSPGLSRKILMGSPSGG